MPYLDMRSVPLGLCLHLLEDRGVMVFPRISLTDRGTWYIKTTVSLCKELICFMHGCSSALHTPEYPSANFARKVWILHVGDVRVGVIAVHAGQLEPANPLYPATLLLYTENSSLIVIVLRNRSLSWCCIVHRCMQHGSSFKH
jgi:hypothetical protein